MMKILLLSNQGMAEPFVGNPIMLRYRDALLMDKHIEEVKMLRCKHPLGITKELREKAKQVDLIHIHFGGMYALIVWFLLLGINKPKLITFHGTDIHAKAIKTANSLSEKVHIKLNQYASFLSMLFYTKCGFVSKDMEEYIPSFFCNILKKKKFLQPLGVDYKLFSPIKKVDAQIQLGLKTGKYILFSDVHNSKIKRRDLAVKIVDRLTDYKLLIMSGVTPDKVPLYINAADCVLLTSDQEGSPNIIREALSLNKPVFSVDVGDAKMQLRELKNSAIISRKPAIAAKEIEKHLSQDYVDNSRERKKNIIDFVQCTQKVIKLYITLIGYEH